MLDVQLEGIDKEVIVVNDGSSDDTGEVLEQYISDHGSTILLFNQDRNRGKGAAIRRGIEVPQVTTW